MVVVFCGTRHCEMMTSGERVLIWKTMGTNASETSSWIPLLPENCVSLYHAVYTLSFICCNIYSEISQPLFKHFVFLAYCQTIGRERLITLEKREQMFFYVRMCKPKMVKCSQKIKTFPKIGNFSKVYLSQVYFCKMYPTCVSSKLCEFVTGRMYV